jgi:hypothetical protein
MAIWNIPIRPFGIFHGLLVYFLSLGLFFLVLVICSKKNLATLKVVSADFDVAAFLLQWLRGGPAQVRGHQGDAGQVHEKGSERWVEISQDF